MIDKTKAFWTGESAGDIEEYLKAYSETDAIDVKSVVCYACGNDTFRCKVGQEEGAIQIKCTKCGHKKILLDSDEVWQEANPKTLRCPVCKISRKYNLRVGFVRRENGSVKWVYIGNRCVKCGVLGSCADWQVDYAPTDEMERSL